MPEFLMVAGVATLFFLLKYQQIRFFVSHIRRSFTELQRPSFRGDPYRNNPEVERDRYKEEAERLVTELQSTRDELQGTRMERDLAVQDRDLRVLKGRAKYGGVFILGAITSFASVNIAPQIASDMLAERPVHARPSRFRSGNYSLQRDDLMVGLLTMAQRYYPYYECAPESCCHRTRLSLIDFTSEFTLRWDPRPAREPRPIEFYWVGSHEIEDILVMTSGGETPPTHPQNPRPIWIERYALPTTRENVDWVPIGATITMTLD